MNREEYLTLLTDRLRPLFEESGKALPSELRVSVGFPSRGARSTKKRTIGECWDGGTVEDRIPQVYVSPVLSTAVDAGATLVHELVHVVVGCKVGHRGPFKRLAGVVGLEGKPTNTHAGPGLIQRLHTLTEALGTYPHSAVVISDRPKQGTRMRKLECPVEGYTVRTTRKWLDELGAPTCPCGTEMMES